MGRVPPGMPPGWICTLRSSDGEPAVYSKANSVFLVKRLPRRLSRQWIILRDGQPVRYADDRNELRWFTARGAAQRADKEEP